MVGKTLSRLANPALFMRVSGPIVPIAGVLALLLIGVGLFRRRRR